MQPYRKITYTAHYDVRMNNLSIISSTQVHSRDRLLSAARNKRSSVHSSVCHVDRSSAAALLTSRGCSPVMSPDGGYVGTCPSISIASSLPPAPGTPPRHLCQPAVSPSDSCRFCGAWQAYSCADSQPNICVSCGTDGGECPADLLSCCWP